jgi:small subunit ribosomal protein S16
MVKIRLQRLGNKGRPYYRVVVTKREAGRNGASVERIGNYNPISNPKEIQIDEERALYWLRQGAVPTETAAYLMNKMGILPKFLEERPTQKVKYKFLDKTTAAISKASVMDSKNEAKGKAASTEVAEPVVEEAVESVAVVEEPIEAAPAEVEAPSEAPAEAEAENA